MKNLDNKTNEEPYISYKDNIIYYVSDEFIKLTGYKTKDFLGKTLEQVSEILRSNIDIGSDDEDISYKKYIFTSQDKPIHINFIFKDLDDNKKKLYFIKTDSNAFLQGVLSTCVDVDKDDRVSEAILNYPDLIHLKTDQNYIKQIKLFNLGESDIIGSILVPLKPIFDYIKEKSYFFEENKMFIDAFGNQKYLTIKANLIFEEGEASYIKTTLIDDTKKVLEGKEFEKKTKEMDIILENTPDAISKLNTHGEYTYMNKAYFEKISPYIPSTDNLTFKEVFDGFQYKNPEIKNLSYDNTAESRVLRGERVDKYDLKSNNKLSSDYHSCSAFPIYDDLGKVESAVIIYRDIADKYKIEEYDALAENIKHLKIRYALISSRDFNIKYINEEVFEGVKLIFPHIDSLSQIIGKNFFDFYNIEEKEEIIENINTCIKEKQSKYVYKKRFIEGGQVNCLKGVFQPIYGDNGQVENINCIGMNITEEVLENEKMARALKAQEEIFINTSHELKTPINLIFSASQLLNIYIENQDLKINRNKLRNSNKIIIQNCYRSIKLINNILDVSRIEEGFYKLDLENRNIVSVIDDIVSTVSDYTKDNNLSIIFDPEVEDLVIAIDLYKFERIMLNLISNAIKFSNQDGDIFISLSLKEDFVEISVKDKGIGIDEENIDSIFDKFKQENKSLSRGAEGTGIGLSLVKSLIEIHGGTVELESKIGLGSNFIIKLPHRRVDKPAIPLDGCEDHENRVEMIKFELSDIYS